MPPAVAATWAVRAIGLLPAMARLPRSAWARAWARARERSSRRRDALPMGSATEPGSATTPFLLCARKPKRHSAAMAYEPERVAAAQIVMGLLVNVLITGLSPPS